VEIPTKFKLFGHTIEVDIDEDLEDRDSAQGIARFNKHKISVQCNKAAKRARTNMEQCYLHEVMHMVFDQLHYSKEMYNEQLIDQLASALHQVLTTSVYDKKRKKARK
jgi:hypothetical protein